MSVYFSRSFSFISGLSFIFELQVVFSLSKKDRDDPRINRMRFFILKQKEMKILIVEDEPSLRELMQRTLEKERYVVEVAATYGQALQKIEDYSYDCILLDIMLPDGSGLDLLDRF